MNCDAMNAILAVNPMAKEVENDDHGNTSEIIRDQVDNLQEQQQRANCDVMNAFLAVNPMAKEMENDDHGNTSEIVRDQVDNLREQQHRAPSRLHIESERDLPANVLTLPRSPSIFRQLYWTIYKNVLLISRRPLMVFCMLFGSVLSVILAWVAGPDSDEPFPQLDECGAVPIKDEYSFNNIPQSLNDSWRNGAPVALLSLGPLVQGICAFIVIHGEIELKLLGVLKSLGVLESIYWLSWYIPFAVTSLINALAATGVAKVLPVHVFQAVYFEGIFASLFFLQLALISASFFLAAVCGSLNRLHIYAIVLMIFAVFVPTILVLSMQAFGDDSPGLFWMNQNTTEGDLLYYNYASDFDPEMPPDHPDYYKMVNMNFDTCDRPIISEEQGTSYKSFEEMLRTQSDEFFIGCYKSAGFNTVFWNPNDAAGEFALTSLFFVPYLHFTTIYSNFLGFTGMPDRTFTAHHAHKSAEELADLSSPSPMNEDNAQDSSLFKQGSTLVTQESLSIYSGGRRYQDWMIEKNGEGWGKDDSTYPYICPDGESLGFDYFCDDFYNGCGYVPKSKASMGSPSLYDMIGYLVALSAIYFILATYWIQVFPAGNGAPKPFYFFLIPSFWIGRWYTTRNDENSSLIILNNISKSFDDSFQALKNVTMKFSPGEITALIGHNGAGKSTLLNILAGETLSTSGDISVYGNDNPFLLHQMIGFCKQDNFLWPDLTAKEHLNIFGGMRCTNRKSHDKIVQEWLESVDLAIAKDDYSSTFSGGMKRRLSVALATIGDRPFVILDEPTDEMDPVSLRYVWKHLDAIKEGRVVLITTHAMEEADLLADDVAILNDGELVASGTPLELKTKYGSTLTFSIQTDTQNVQKTEFKIKEILPIHSKYVTISSSIHTGKITVKIERLDKAARTHKLSDFVSWLESDESNVLEYGFSCSSLEDVFMAVIKNDFKHSHDIPNIEDSDKEDSYDQEIDEEGNAIMDEDHQEAELIDHISGFKMRLNVLNQTEAWARHVFLRKWTGRRSFVDCAFFGALIFGTFLAGNKAAGTGGDVLILIPFMTIPVLAINLILPSIIYPFHFDKVSGLLQLMKNQGLLSGSLILGSALYAFATQFIYGSLLLNLFYATPIFRETQMCEEYTETICSNDSTGQEYCYKSSDWCWNRGYFDPHREFGQNIVNPDKDSNIHITASRTPGGYITMFLIPLIFALSTIGSTFIGASIPGNHKVVLVLLIISVLVTSFVPLANHVHFFYQSHYGNESMYTQCKESLDPLNVCNSLGDLTLGKDLTADDYLDCIGIDVNHDGILPTLCTPSYASMLPQFGMLQLLSMMLSAEIKFHSTEPGYVEDIFIPQLQSQGANCSGNSCKFPKIQTIYLENMLYFLQGALILAIVGMIPFVVIHHTPSALKRFQRSCSRCKSRIFGSDSARSPVYPVAGDPSPDGTMTKMKVMDEVLEETAMVHNMINPVSKASIPTTAASGDDDDDDHAPEPPKIKGGSKKRSNLPLIITYNLRKVYPSVGKSPPKVALNSLNLHVPKGQVLGLLGKNGSGKSTCLNMISTSTNPSGGKAYVAGHNVSRQQHKVIQELGSCPQSDTIWPNLSVKHHLTFFARLKGLPRKAIREAAHDVANAVGLGGARTYNIEARFLSGGMRRRLSIAISILGAPRVWTIDEPCIGLDPQHKHKIWNLIRRFTTEERAAIVTTNSMAEAEALCDRIAIIAEGNLRVVGTQQQLKDTYGSGYTLHVNLVRNSKRLREEAMEFVKTHIHPDAKLEIQQAKTLHISLPLSKSIVGKVFKVMDSPERTNEGNNINQFLLQQSSLEDVLIALQ